MIKQSEIVSQKRIKTDYPGVSYRVRNRRDGGGSDRVFYGRYKRHGRRYEEILGRSSEGMTAAKASRVRTALMEGRKTSKADDKKTKKWTFNKLMDDQANEWKRIKGELSDYHTGRIQVYKKHFAPYIGHLRPADLSADDYFDLVDRMKNCQVETEKWSSELIIAQQTGDIKRQKEISEKIKNAPKLAKSTVWVNFTLLRQLSNRAAKLYNCAPMHPNNKVKEPKAERIATLSDDQMTTIIRTCKVWKNRTSADTMMIAFLTGMRHGAILKLKWEHVDFYNGLIILESGKARDDDESDVIPMNDMAEAYLRDLRKRSEFNHGYHYVVSNKKGGKRKGPDYIALNKLRDACGLPKDFRPVHDLRHGFACAAIQGGARLEEVQKLLCHKFIQTTQRYARFDMQHLKKASNFFSSRVKAAKGGEIVPLRAVK